MTLCIFGKDISHIIYSDISEIVSHLLYHFPGWQDILDTQHKNQGQLFIKIIYKPYVDNCSPTADLACPDTYFPLRRSNKVTLYSCARSLPSKDSNGRSYQSPSLWLDVYRSLVASEKFIYITGWSVNTKIKLLRYVNIQVLSICG